MEDIIDLRSRYLSSRQIARTAGHFLTLDGRSHIAVSQVKRIQYIFTMYCTIELTVFTCIAGDKPSE
jgi:hypothetical protein